MGVDPHHMYRGNPGSHKADYNNHAPCHDNPLVISPPRTDMQPLEIDQYSAYVGVKMGE